MNNENDNVNLAESELDELRRIRILDQKCWSILKEFLVYIIFIVVLYEVAFANISLSAKPFNQLYLYTFVHQQSANEIGLYDVSFEHAFNK